MLKWLGGGGGSSGNQGNGGSNKSTMIGRMFQINEYNVTVEDVLAEGGFALVFLVKTISGHRLALKRLAVNNDQDLYLARQEIAITKALSDCPYSVTYLSSVIRQLSSDVHEILILMELYTGTSVIDLLNQRLSSSSQLTQNEVLHIFSDVTKAVARLHHRTKPIIHRDLKIENVLHDSRTNKYILCDYGSCTLKNMHPEDMGASECSDEISRFTTLPYRSPEMVSLYSGKTITTKSDIWALGVMLYKLCFMETPFGDNPLAIVSVQYSIPEDSFYTQDLHNLIGYLLTPDPSARPTIWQVCEVVSRLTGQQNYVTNAFNSVRPPNPLPSPKKARTVAKKQTVQSNPSVTVTPINTARAQAATVTMTTISSRDRPRARGQSARQPVSNLKASNQNAALHKSFESGLDAFGHVPFTGPHRVASESNLTKATSAFGDDWSSTPPQPPTQPPSHPLHAVRRDLFGAPPFGEATPAATATVDQFGAVPFN